MKRKRISIFIILIITLFLTISTAYADDPPSPPGEVRGDDIPIGGNAPVGVGTIFLIGLAATYGVKILTSSCFSRSRCSATLPSRKTTAASRLNTG